MTEFTNKIEYLAFRANWKSRYKELSQEIRETRAAIREEGDENRRSSLQVEKAYLRKQACAMMTNLDEAKIEANRQWLAESKLVTV